MIITNSQNLPKPFVDAVTRNYEYKDKRYSVTSILKGPKEILLTRRHYSEIKQDVADSIWMILGCDNIFLLRVTASTPPR